MAPFSDLPGLVQHRTSDAAEMRSQWKEKEKLER